MKKFLLPIILLIILIGGSLVVTYNKLITASENVDNQWAQVEAQYQRRFDLIPNLVSSVQGIMSQEQEIFGQLADARTRYSAAASTNDKVAAASDLESSLGRLLVIMENYPQLNSVENVQTLMVQLEGTENRISVERMRYNDMIKTFNVSIKRIPVAWIAAALGFSEKLYFEAQEGTEKAPSVVL